MYCIIITPKTSFCQNASIGYYLHVIYYYTCRIIREYLLNIYFYTSQKAVKVKLQTTQLQSTPCEQQKIARLNIYHVILCVRVVHHIYCIRSDFFTIDELNEISILFSSGWTAYLLVSKIQTAQRYRIYVEVEVGVSSNTRTPTKSKLVWFLEGGVRKFRVRYASKFWLTLTIQYGQLSARNLLCCYILITYTYLLLITVNDTFD